MKKLFFYIACIAISTLILHTNNLKAQSIEDALRLAVPNGMITPRVASLNVAYYGLSDDIGALMYNPAGITISPNSEMSFGFGFTRNSAETDFFNIKDMLKSNNSYITNVGFLAPFKVGERNASVGIGLFQESDFTNNMKFDAFNPNSSLIAWEANPNNSSFDYNDNMATYLYLANNNYQTPLKDSLQQKASIQETGGLYNITGAMAFELNDNVSLGFTISGKWGSYGYAREYSETDTKNIYNFYDTTNWSNLDFRSLALNEKIDQSISGITGSLGIMTRFLDFIRAGITIKFPTWYQVSENYSRTASVTYDNGDHSASPYVGNGTTSYNITTPFVFSGGFSVYALGLTFAGGVEYTDVTQIQFTDGTPYVMGLNPTFVQELVGQTTWGFGVEYKIPMVPVVVRSSFASTTSPYTVDVSHAYVSYFSLGGALYLGPNIRMDGVFRWTSNSVLRTNYGSIVDGSFFTLANSNLNMGLQFTYRY